MERHKNTPWQHVGYEDVGRMHFFDRAHRNPKHTPLWAASDKKIQLVVYNYLFQYCRKHGAGRELIPGMSLMDLEKLADKLREAWHERAKNSSPEYQNIVATHIRTATNGMAATRVRMIYMAYRQRLLSEDIADALDMTRSQVRVVLSRLNAVARKLFPQDCSLRPWWAKPGRFRKTRSLLRSDVTETERARERDLLATISARHQAGEPLMNLSREFGFSYRTLWFRFKEYGFPTNNRCNPTKVKKPPTYDLKLLEDIVARYKAGETITSLAREIGLSEGALRGRFVARGLYTPRHCRVNHDR
jgi:lambda repressor-like predicted transcriptional regulator